MPSCFIRSKITPCISVLIYILLTLLVMKKMMTLKMMTLKMIWIGSRIVIRGRMRVEGPDPQLAVLLAIGEGVGGAGPGLEGEGPGLEVAGPGLVGLPVLVVSRMMMRTLGMTSLPFNQTVRREFILVGKSCGEV
jgi:hypothetical protein